MRRNGHRGTFRTLVAVAVVLAAARAAVAEKATYPCYRIEGAIAVDGKLDEATWRRLPSATGFSIPGAKGYAVTRQTSFRMGWDDTHLYVGVRCIEPAAEKIRLRFERNQGAVYFEDSVELFFAPTLLVDRPPYYRLAVSSGGFMEGPTRYDGHMQARTLLENTGAETAATVEENAWTCEARIPFAVFGLSPKEDPLWAANIARNVRVVRGTGEEFTSWTRLSRLNWHAYDQYNRLAFETKTLTEKEAAALDEELNGAFRAHYEKILAMHERAAEIARIAEESDIPNLCAYDQTALREKRLRVTATSTVGSQPVNVLQEENLWRTLSPKPQAIEIRFEEPITLNALLLRWMSQKNFPSWYSVEIHDGTRYVLLTEERDNGLGVSAHRFDPVTTERIRVYQYLPRYEGYMNAHMRQIEAYRLPDGKN